MSELMSGMPSTLIATAAGYLLGAVPLAYLISRRYAGVDIFEVGTGLPGASNVLRNVGKLPAILVFLGDAAKGVVAVAIAMALGVESPWLIVPAGAAVVGHWRSIFTGFRGGDGLATLGGAIVALFPVDGSISIGIALVVALLAQKMPYSSLLNVVVGYASLAALTVLNDGDTALAVGMGGLCGLVLAHATHGHFRRRQTPGWDEVDEEPGVAERS